MANCQLKGESMRAGPRCMKRKLPSDYDEETAPEKSTLGSETTSSIRQEQLNKKINLAERATRASDEEEEVENVMNMMKMSNGAMQENEEVQSEEEEMEEEEEDVEEEEGEEEEEEDPPRMPTLKEIYSSTTEICAKSMKINKQSMKINASTVEVQKRQNEILARIVRANEYSEKRAMETAKVAEENKKKCEDMEAKMVIIPESLKEIKSGVDLIPEEIKASVEEQGQKTVENVNKEIRIQVQKVAQKEDVNEQFSKMAQQIKELKELVLKVNQNQTNTVQGNQEVAKEPVQERGAPKDSNKRAQCTLCSKIFAKQSNVNRHFSKVHDPPREFKRYLMFCMVDKCEESSRIPRVMALHTKFHNKQPENKPLIPAYSMVFAYKCVADNNGKLCDFESFNDKEFDKHIDKHITNGATEKEQKRIQEHIFTRLVHRLSGGDIEYLEGKKIAITNEMWLKWYWGSGYDTYMRYQEESRAKAKQQQSQLKEKDQKGEQETQAEEQEEGEARELQAQEDQNQSDEEDIF